MDRHEVINNTLRLEVLGKLIIENLEQNNIPSNDFIKDYSESLKKQLTLIEQKSTATVD
jgi:hypothetical protein